MSIKIDLKIFLFFLLFLLTSQIEIYIILMIFAIIHELGHLLAGFILKFKAEEIKVTPVGLQIKFKLKFSQINYVHSCSFSFLKRPVCASIIMSYIKNTIFALINNPIISF